MGNSWPKTKIWLTKDRTVSINCEFAQFTTVGRGDFLYSFIILSDLHIDEKREEGSHYKQLKEIGCLFERYYG
jgi:hypothetical protein